MKEWAKWLKLMHDEAARQQEYNCRPRWMDSMTASGQELARYDAENIEQMLVDVARLHAKK